jgi:hypothetical protein
MIASNAVQHGEQEEAHAGDDQNGVKHETPTGVENEYRECGKHGRLI